MDISVTPLVPILAGGTAASLIAVLTFMATLVIKEIAGGIEGARAAQLARALSVAVVPLFIVFVVALIARVLPALT